MKLQISLQKTLKKYLESNSTYYKTPIGIAKITGDNNGIQAITFMTNNLNEVNPKINWYGSRYSRMFKRMCATIKRIL